MISGERIISDNEIGKTLSEMKHRSLSALVQKEEGAKVAAVMYLGALDFLKRLGLIQEEIADLLMNQFESDFESLENIKSEAEGLENLGKEIQDREK
jgi:hypothetical protein